jgi:hypothetical protein
MTLQISEEERDILRILESGIRRVQIFRNGLYPGTVSFESSQGRWVTIRARAVDLAPRFEVFPIAISNDPVKSEVHQEISTPEFAPGCGVSILSKGEWSVPSSPRDKETMLGDTNGATTQYEGRPSDAPSSALHSTVLDAGVELRTAQGQTFSVATSMSPFALYVSSCSFSEVSPISIYERSNLR